MSAMGEARPILIGIAVAVGTGWALWGVAYALGAPEEIYGTLALVGVCIGVCTGVLLREREVGREGWDGPRRQRRATRRS